MKLLTSLKLPTQRSLTNAPYLIQRLQRARGTSPFAFGGGNTAETQQAVKKLDECFSFDYMGAAEYEFGAFPKALKILHGHKLTLASFDTFVFVKRYERRGHIVESFNRRVWGVFPAHYAQAIAEWIDLVAGKDYNELLQRNPGSIRPPRDNPKIGWDHLGERWDIIGGFCEDAGHIASSSEVPPFAYFTEPQPFACFAQFLGLTVPPEWMEDKKWNEAAQRAQDALNPKPE